MKQFILIDQSITDIGGHHYEYAVRVLEAAKKAEYTPVLATNRKMKVDVPIPWAVHPVYRYRFFIAERDSMLYTLLCALKQRAGRWWFRLKALLLFSPVGKMWAWHSDPKGLLGSYARVKWSDWVYFFGAYLFTVAVAAARFVYTAIPFKIYIKNMLGAFAQFAYVATRPVAMLIRPPKWAGKWLADQRKRTAFGKNTIQLFKKIRLQPGDLVFIPTLAEPEMLGLLEHFRKDPTSKNASWHLLFRRNIYEGREPDYPAQEESLRATRNAFQQFQKALDSQSVHLYTDTEELTAQYDRLGSGKFHTLPIPVNVDYRSSGSHGEVASLDVIYIGDARTEKGYHYLPQVIQDLWPGYVEGDRIRFRLQSYYNMPDGEPAAVVARAQLESFPSEGVKLFVHALPSDEYRDFLVNSDVVLILYDRDNYYARSSGIFVEALVAGKPVVVPAGSWMALGLSEACYRYHGQLRDEYLCIQAGPGHPAVRESRSALFLRQSATHREIVSVPRGATHLMVTFTPSDSFAGRFIDVAMNLYDGNNRRCGRRHAVTGGGKCPGSVLMPLHAEAQWILLKMKNAYSPSAFGLGELEMDFLKAPEETPLSVVGAVYPDPSSISMAVREIADHFEHYRATAEAFASDYSAFHNPSSLVEHLADREVER